MSKKRITKKNTRVFARRWVMPLTIIAIALGAIFLALIVYASTTTYKGAERTRIYIPSGATDEAICDTLTKQLGNDFGAPVFRMWQIFGNGAERAVGSYVVEPGENVRSVVHRLNNGLQTPLRFTFNNVRKIETLADKASARMTFTSEEFMAACDSVLPMRGYGSKAQYAAAFVPDTYEFYWTATPVEMVTRLADERDAFWNEERRAQAKALGLTPVEVATVASIVEEESNLAEDRGHIARLYLNRLQQGMMLQADPTVKYAVGDFGLRRILANHLETPSPYNTYKHTGLPPGPIRIAERNAIDQVLNAPQNDYLYMCASADFSGRHAFAHDYATHQANARAYRSALDKRGIK